MNKQRHTHTNNDKGFTLVELMVAMVIIGILSGIAISSFSSIKMRSYDSAAQASLKNVFQMCKDYWTFGSSDNACLLSTLANGDSGYTPPADIVITIDPNANNTEYDFVATARHTSSTHAFEMDFSGIVSQVAFEVAEGGEGNGCSDQAQQDPKNLKKKAKGGCKQPKKPKKPKK